MRFLFFASLLLAQVDVDKKVEKEQSKIAIEFFGKQINVFESEVDKANELISKFSLPPSDILDIFSGLDNIVSNPEEELKRGERSFAIFFVDEANAMAASDLHDDTVTIFISTDEKLASKMNVPFPGVYAFSSLDKVSYRVALPGKTAKNVAAILKTPVLGGISYENFGIYRATEMPLLYLFAKPEELEKTKDVFYDKVKQCRNFGKFVIIPYDASRISPDVFGFSEEHLPVLVFIKERAKYNLLKAEDKDFMAFIEGAIKGTLEPFYASEKEPENNGDREVKVVTRNNLIGIVNDNTKDRLLVFTSPDCQFCKTLKPVLEEFGKIVKENSNDKLFVGNADVTLNDITEFDVTAVPAIYIVKAGTNERVKLEGGDRTLEALAKFVLEKGALSVDLTAFVPAKEEKPQEDLPMEETLGDKMSDREEL